MPSGHLLCLEVVLKPSVALGIQTLTCPAWSWILRLSNIAPEAQLLRSLPHRRPCHPKRSGLYSTANLLHRERNFGPKPKIRSSLLRILCLIPWLGFSLHESRVNYQNNLSWEYMTGIWSPPSTCILVFLQQKLIQVGHHAFLPDVLKVYTLFTPMHSRQTWHPLSSAGIIKPRCLWLATVSYSSSQNHGSTETDPSFLIFLNNSHGCWILLVEE